MTPTKPSEKNPTPEELVAKPRLKQRMAQRVQRHLVREAVDGVRLATRARTIALMVIAVWVVIDNGIPGAYFYLGIIAIFLTLGLAHLKLANAAAPTTWPSYVFISLDAVLLAYTLVVPNPLLADHWPIQMQLRPGNFAYFYVLIASTLFMYSPAKVLWAGFSAVGAWVGTALWIIGRPQTVTQLDIDKFSELGVSEQLFIFLDPHYADIFQPIRDAFILLVVTGIFAAVVTRMRLVVMRQTEAERERANLARYFSPAVVDQLAQTEGSLSEVRKQNAAVLFADIVDFTGFAEHQTPEETIAMLREFHALIAEQIFAHDGNIDKYIGDAVMGTFGIPKPGQMDPANALASARDILADVKIWNEKRQAEGRPKMRVSIGLHFGPVVTGDIGDERRLEFAVIGDTVNVASRLEQLTRGLNVGVVASDSVVSMAQRSGKLDETLFSALTRGAPQAIRGRDANIDVWTLPTA
jgi:adenylate cyclase